MKEEDIHIGIQAERKKFWDRNHRESWGTAVDDVLIFDNGIQLYITGWRSATGHSYEVRSWNKEGTEVGNIIASYGITNAHLKQRPMTFGVSMFGKIHLICKEMVEIFAASGIELVDSFNYVSSSGPK